MLNCEIPVTDIKGIGDKTAKLMSKLDINNVDDLLTYYPRDYEEYQDPVNVKDIVCNKRNAILATVKTVTNIKHIRNLAILNMIVGDENGIISLTFFNMAYLKKTIKPGAQYVFLGIPRLKGTTLIMEQPRIFTPDNYLELCHILTPKYPLTKGLSNTTLVKGIRKALVSYSYDGLEYPEDFRQRFGLMSGREALKLIHEPENWDDVAKARKRLVFDEFLEFMVMIRHNREMGTQLPNKRVYIETADTVRFVEALPYKLTKAQKRVWQEVREDMEGPFCMNRLIQGDVGSGKTIIALLALLMNAANGYQGAFMAPTEVLAAQHLSTVNELIQQYNLAFSPILLIGSMTAKEKRVAREGIASGKYNLVIGTHALIQDAVEFKNLGLVVTDEQHRFGVRQREALSEKGKDPHVLVMSATPIPRTLAIILYGDLNISVMDELPANRLPIKNCVVNTNFREKSYKFIADEIAKGRQAYIICPMVESGEEEDSDLENVVDYSEKVRASLPENINVAYLHGKMKPAQKNSIMNEFAAGNIHVLVSTTVIEVGINVPNATVMMIENADRFGLAQLHQLRGRVGRGEYQSYCILINTNENPNTTERLTILNTSNDGFFIASEDLRLRGPGELFGVRQSGEMSLGLGDIYNDANVLKDADEACRILEEQYPDIRERILDRNSNLIDFRSI